jgi:hypothetical protein
MVPLLKMPVAKPDILVITDRLFGSIAPDFEMFMA